MRLAAVRAGLGCLVLLAACGGGDADPPVPTSAPATVPAPAPVASDTAPPAAPPLVPPPPPSPAAPPAPPTVEVAVRTERLVSDDATAGFDAAVRGALTDARGWSRAGFALSVRDDAPYRIVLAEGAEVDRLCAPYRSGGRFSCQRGPTVALNADRWRTATESWPGTLEEYRVMLVNHEVGHLLGQHHPAAMCTSPGGPAALMAQQSKGLSGCTHTVWPLEWEVACAARHEEPLAPEYEATTELTCGPDG